MLTSGFRSWAAYRKGFLLARRVHRITSNFPPSEKSLTDQIRRSSRSGCANLGEVYAVRTYPKHYRSKLAIAIGENFETQVWLDFAVDAKYIMREDYLSLCQQSEEVGKLLSYMQSNPARFVHWKAL